MQRTPIQLLRSLPGSLTLLLLGGMALVTADEVKLSDGRVLEGEVISRPGADVLDLRTGSSSLSVTQHFPSSQVVAVTYGVSPRQKALAAIAAEAKRLGDGGSAEEWWALAERAREIGDSPYHRELAAITVERDRNHAAARRVLGMVKYKGVWMRPNEAAVARGEVFQDGHYMTWNDREEAIRQAQVHKEQVASRRAEQEKEARERRLRAAAEAAAYSDPGPGPGLYSSSSAYGAYAIPVGPAYRAVYWPGLCPTGNGMVYGNTRSGSILSVSASGHSGSTSWSLNWNN
jgi:hypothetical protein